MRHAATVLLAALVILLQGRPAPAQKADKKTEPRKSESEKTQKLPQVTEILGKNVDQWVAEIRSPDKSKAENAIRTVLLFGPEQSQKAVPVLLKELHSSSFEYPLDVSIRVNACIALGAILGSAKDPDEAQVKDVVKQLKRLLRDNQDIVKYRAAQAAAALGPQARDLLPELLSALKYSPNSWETRQAAALALGRVAWERKKAANPEIIQALATRLKNDKTSQVRLAALQALASLGPPADKTKRFYLEKDVDTVATRDPDQVVRIWAHMTHMILKGDVDATRLKFIGKLVVEGTELQVKLQAIEALGRIGPKAKSQIPRLVEGIDDADKNVTAACILVLAGMGKPAEEAVPRLQKLAKDKQAPEELTHLATEAVAVIEGRTKSKSDTKEKSKAPAGAQ
jgi:HEAT repeat protein